MARLGRRGFLGGLAASLGAVVAGKVISGKEEPPVVKVAAPSVVHSAPSMLRKGWKIGDSEFIEFGEIQGKPAERVTRILPRK